MSLPQKLPRLRVIALIDIVTIAFFVVKSGIGLGVITLAHSCCIIHPPLLSTFPENCASMSSDSESPPPPRKSTYSRGKKGKGKQRRVTDFEFSTDEIAILKAKVGKWKTSGKSAREDIVDDMALEIAEKRGVQDKNLFAALLVKVR